MPENNEHVNSLCIAKKTQVSQTEHQTLHKPRGTNKISCNRLQQ